jgi:hypothetical protein
MEKKNKKFNYGAIGAVVLSLVVGLVAVFGVVSAFNGGLNFNIENAVFNISSGVEAITDKLGGSTSDDWDVGGNLTVAGNATITGTLTSSGAIAGEMSLSTVSTRVASTTLAITDTGKTFILTTTTEFVLPATSTSAGVHYKFVVGAAMTASSTVRTLDLSNGIEGTLIVAGAVVDCATEDVITFGGSGENVGDYFELWSNGTYWFIGDSGALTAGAFTCTADGS